MYLHSRMPREGMATREAVAGFTMIELMITIALVAIMISLAYPSFVSVVNSNRLAGATNDLVGDLQYARSEAIRRNTRVTACASSDGSTCSGSDWSEWIVRVGAPAEVLRVGHAEPPVQLLASASADAEGVTFRSDGLARKADGTLHAATFGICMETTNPEENVRELSLAFGSRITTKRSDGGGACAAPDDE